MGCCRLWGSLEMGLFCAFCETSQNEFQGLGFRVFSQLQEPSILFKKFGKDWWFSFKNKNKENNPTV
jgi:hypothetical protein